MLDEAVGDFPTQSIWSRTLNPQGPEGLWLLTSVMGLRALSLLGE